MLFVELITFSGSGGTNNVFAGSLKNSPFLNAGVGLYRYINLTLIHIAARLSGSDYILLKLQIKGDFTLCTI